MTGIILALCLPVYGQNWQDEEHVWNEETQQWDVRNRAGGRTLPEDGPVSQMLTRPRPFAGYPWERYLPKSVQRGRREPTSRELAEAERKLWAKEVITQRAMAKAEQRRQLIASRKASGWYSRRSQNAFAPGPSMKIHMQTSGYRY